MGDQLTDLDRILIERSSDLKVTGKRIQWVVAVAVLLVAGASFLYWRGSYRLLLGLTILYVLMTTLEKMSYGAFVLSYKKLVTKLAKQVIRLEKDRAESS